MKKLLMIILVLSFIGCAGVKNAVPPGKTVENDWERDELSCRQQSGKVAGILAPTMIGFIENKAKGADDRYMKCMIELGWYK
jgi:hypothetical protein